MLCISWINRSFYWLYLLGERRWYKSGKEGRSCSWSSWRVGKDVHWVTQLANKITKCLFMIILINIILSYLKTKLYSYHWFNCACLSKFSAYTLLLISTYFYTPYLFLLFNLSFINCRIYSFSISSAYSNILVPSSSSIPSIYSTVSNSINCFTTSTRYLSIAKCRG